MNQTRPIIKALKQALKSQGKTYADVASCLSLSEASVKRLFAEHNFTLERLELICDMLALDLLELLKMATEEQSSLKQLTLDQEQELVSDLRLLLVAHSLMNRWSVAEIMAAYSLTEPETVQLLARLDRMKLIELLPGNRVKLLIDREFSWQPSGPIQRFFEQQVRAEFLNARFNGKGEYLAFNSGMLSEASIIQLLEKLRKTVQKFNDMNRADEVLPLSQRYGTSLLIATRPWEISAFVKQRRSPSEKSLKS